MHPLAIKHEHRNGARGMKAGDRVRHIINGRYCVADEFLQDGDTLVTWEDDAANGCVKWAFLEPAPLKDFSDVG